jgi:hypothetical protein
MFIAHTSYSILFCRRFRQGINVQDILKLKARFSRRVSCFCRLYAFPIKSAAINTVSGVNMTTRRQMLKIKASRLSMT